MRQPNGTQTAIEKEICDWYQDYTIPIKDIMDSHGLAGYSQLYAVLDKHSIPRRLSYKAHADKPTVAKPSEPSKPTREWFLLDECAVIVGMQTADIEWLIRKGAVHAEEGTTASGGKFTLVYLPSLVDANAHASIDGKRAKQLLQEAWTMLEKVSRQRAINLEDAKFITTAIRDFFVQHGWNLG